MNRNWPRWFEASVFKVFKAAAAVDNIPLHYEGLDRIAIRGVPQHLEIRVDGPVGSEISRDFWVMDMEVNCVVETIPDNQNQYSHSTLIGIAASYFPSPLKIYRLGPATDVVNDGSLLGCMSVEPIVSGDRPYKISRFGQVEASTKVIQATVEVHYRGHFDG